MFSPNEILGLGKKILAGLPVKNQGALANPNSLELYNYFLGDRFLNGSTSRVYFEKVLNPTLFY